MFATSVTPLERVRHPRIAERGLELYVKREDLLDPRLSGNKSHKLRLNLAAARARGCQRVVSFGGAYSNHLHALAWAGRQAGLQTVGVVRGELVQPLNATLRDAEEWGMQLVPVSRSEYRRRDDPDYVAAVSARYGGAYVIPEGGANALGVAGCSSWARQIREQCPDLDYLCVACGTGATLAGLIAGVGPGPRVLGFSALKGDAGVTQRVQEWLAGHSATAQWDIIPQYHFGGFAKLDAALVTFMDGWHARTRIPLEPVYTAKMFFGILALAEAGYFVSGAKIVAVHSGGLQGLRGMQAKLRRLR